MSSASFGDEMPYNELLAKNNSFMLQNERFKAFKEQDTEKGHFDVTFEIEGKMLHANKVFLTTISERFDAWLSDRWSTKDKPVKVEDSSYDNFYQFLCFIYSGFCKINRGNAFHLTDMAESYGVTCLKNICDEALSKQNVTIETVEEMYEHADLYTLPKLMDSVKSYVLSPYNGGNVYRDENFLAFKKPFVQYLSTFPRIPDYPIPYGFPKCRKESEFFESVYKWAERQVQNKTALGDDAFDVQEAIKAELETIIPNPKFCDMSYEFLLNFVVEKGFSLSAAEFSKFFVKYRRERQFVDEETHFKTIYELSERQAIYKQKMCSGGDNFNLSDYIRTTLVETIPHIGFYRMSEEFLMDFIVEKYGFTFSSTELSKFYENCSGSEDERFRRVYRLTEKQASEKQNKDPVDNFNLAETIKADLVETISNVNFYRMTEEFLMDFVVKKWGFTFSSTELFNFYQGLQSLSITEEKRFELIYRLTKKQVLIKQKKSPVNNFILGKAIDDDLEEVLPIVKFRKMSKNFLIDFVVKKGFFLSPFGLSNFHTSCIGTERERFEQVYELTEKQALLEQKFSSDSDNFDLAEKIKVAKGFITEEQVIHVYDIHFEVENNGHRIRGTLEDNADICRAIDGRESCVVRRNNIKTAKRRFKELKLPVPSTPSSVQKMVGCEWYLCFERDKVLTLKHHSLIQRHDYLLAEMKGDADFELDPDGLTTLIAKCNNI